MIDTAPAAVAESGFATAGIRTVLLPSGWRVKGVITSLKTLARHGLLSPSLLEAAQNIDDAQWALVPAHRQAIVQLVDLMIVSFIREAQPPGSETWEHVALTPADVDTFDPADLDLLEDLVLGIKTPEEVTALSEGILNPVASATPDASESVADATPTPEPQPEGATP